MDFLKKLQKYVLLNKDFDVVNIAGSFSDTKNQNRYDSFSDIDLFIVTEKKDDYLKNPNWLSFYDNNFIYFNDPISLGIGNELRVGFNDGLFVDIAIVNNEEFCQLKENKIFCEKIIDRGFKIIKNNYKDDYFLHKSFEKQKISNYDLNRLIDEYWIDIANICKYIARGDLFSAKYAFDRRITKILVKVIEIYVKTDNNSVDVLFNGRGMINWLDKKILDDFYCIESSLDQKKMINTLKLANFFFQEKMQSIFNYYNYQFDVNREKIINLIKERIDRIG